MKIRNFIILHLLLGIAVAVVSSNPWPSLMLTVAQLVYVPIALRFVFIKGDWFSKNYFYFAMPAYVAVALLQITSSKWNSMLAGVYLLFTIVIAVYGISRFLKRGFTHLEAFSIDLGLIYLAMGGGWFFAYVAQFDTGFSPLLTWLTSIHFHYSAFLLPIFVGLFGRLHKSSFYKVICTILLVSPMVVAIGITFSRWIELLSVLLYIVGLYGLIYLTIQTTFANKVQKWLVGISFGSLGVTIVFSLLYALGNGFGIVAVSIDFMLRFHGLLNCIAFALLGIIGWAIAIPPANYTPPIFPLSKLRGNLVIGEQFLESAMLENKTSTRGLVDTMSIYEPQINRETLSPLVVDFYENTMDYRLFATIKWHSWFKPFAFVYSFVSRKMQQINLPLKQEEVEMTGAIYPLKEGIDGRNHVRAWMRKVDGVPAFVALYSAHKNKDRTYMNIALPLPFSSMVGILELNQIENGLQLTSKKGCTFQSDAGIYLTTHTKQRFKLPIEEVFNVQEIDGGILTAQHDMWIFSIPFLTIQYSIHRNEILKMESSCLS